MYRCSRCGDTKPAQAFYPRRGRAKPVYDWCRDCFRDYRLVYYAVNRESERRRVRAVSRRLLERWRHHRLEYLRRHPCVDCGESDPAVLEFDHRRDKLDSLATYARKRCLALIEKEIEKCEVRCANCHRRRTARERGYYKWREGSAN